LAVPPVVPLGPLVALGRLVPLVPVLAADGEADGVDGEDDAVFL
jgi:hypothetical protein